MASDSISVCWPDDRPSSYTKAAVYASATVVILANSVYLVARLKYDVNHSRLGRIVSTFIIINSIVPSSIRIIQLIYGVSIGVIGARVCFATGALQTISMHFQACLISALAQDRLYVIQYPLNYQELYFEMKPVVLLTLLMIPPTVVGLVAVTNGDSVCFDDELGCLFQAGSLTLQSKLSGMLMIVLQVGCLAWFCYCYARIYMVARRAVGQDGTANKAVVRTFTVLCVQHVVFVVVPLALLLALVLQTSTATASHLYETLMWLYSGNDMLSSTIYVLLDRGYRGALAKLCSCGRRAGVAPLSGTSSSTSTRPQHISSDHHAPP